MMVQSRKSSGSFPHGSGLLDNLAVSVRQCALVSPLLTSVMLSFRRSTAVCSLLCYRPGSDPGCYSIPLVRLWALTDFFPVYTITRKQKVRIFSGCNTHRLLPWQRRGCLFPFSFLSYGLGPQCIEDALALLAEECYCFSLSLP